MASRGNRTAREAVTADLGQRGRRTGAAMPAEGEIPLTQDGFEDPDAYFKSPAATHSAKKTYGRSLSSHYASNGSGVSPPQRSQSQQPPSSASRRQRPAHRPDVTHEIGVRGRKTGAAIVSNRRMPVGPNGMDDMDAYFAINPASVPAVNRTKRVSAIREEFEDMGEDGEEEDEDEDEQTANYGGRGQARPSASRVKARQSLATTAGESDDDEELEEGNYQEDEDGEEEEGDEEEDGDDEGDEEDGGEEQYDEDEYNRTMSSVGRGRRQSHAGTRRASEYGDQVDDDEEDYGTQTMELENTSYFEKSQRSISSFAASGRGKRTADTSIDTTPGQASSGSRASKRSRANASTSRSRLEQAEEDSESDEDQAVHNSLTKSARDARQRLPEASGSSPVFDKRGKGRALFQEGSEADGGDADEQQNGGYGDQGFNDYEPPDHQDYSDDNDAGGFEDNQYARQEGEVDEEQYDDQEQHAFDDPEDGRVESEDDDAAERYDNDPAPLPTTNKGSQKRKQNSTPTTPQTIVKTTGQKRKRYSYNTDGLRRSGRDVTKPVEYWRNERVIYRRRDSGPSVYYEKVGVAERPKPPPKSLVHKRGTSRARSASQAPSKAATNSRGKTRSVSVIPNGDDVEEQDWSKWDEETDPDGIVWDYVEGREIKKRVAFTKAMLDPKPTKNHAYRFQRIFTDGEFMAGGILVIPPGEAKPLKPARDNTYMLYCAQGAVRVLVHRTEFSIAQGGYFLVPRGNSYQINNLTDVDAVLVFMQAREVAAIVEPDEAGE